MRSRAERYVCAVENRGMCRWPNHTTMEGCELRRFANRFGHVWSQEQLAVGQTKAGLGTVESRAVG